jgi:hypothetical protein
MLKKELGVDARLEVGGMGQYEVCVDGESVIRKENGVFPTERDVVEAVRKNLVH